MFCFVCFATYDLTLFVLYVLLLYIPFISIYCFVFLNACVLMFCLYKLLLTMSYYAEIINKLSVSVSDEPRREKTDLRGFRTGPTQIGLYRNRSRLEG